MTIQTEIQLLSPSAYVELFVLDTSNLPGGGLAYFHAGTNSLTQPIVWGGNNYSALPVEATGFEVTAKGTLPRPTFKVANINGLFSAEVRDFDDLVGCKVTRKRTFSRYLDAVNFPGGVNPTADPSQSFPDDIWYVERKVNENRYVIEWELSSAFDLQGVQLPARQVIQNSCSWKYRGAECSYTGGYVNTNDVVTGVQANDVCGKRLSSCKARFGTGILPFGGFPGAVRN